MTRTVLELAAKGGDWAHCPHCHQSMTASYGGILRCIRCVVRLLG